MFLSRLTEILGINSFSFENIKLPKLFGSENADKPAENTSLKPNDSITYSVSHSKPSAPLVPLFPANDKLDEKLKSSVYSAEKELKSGVKETNGPNRSKRIDQYARNSQFSPGNEWCGFFVAYNYAQSGFKHSPDLASYQKARDFFMYRSLTNRSYRTNSGLDNLRSQHETDNSSRKYVMLQESPNISYVKANKNLFSHYNVEENTYNYKNIPIASGDAVLFTRGHIGIVKSYDPNSGKLVTIEGNASGKGYDGKVKHGAVVTNEYDLSKSSERRKFDGFGRPALGDFE